MKNLKKGFTLVELIVVITILAILGSIAFISLQGYSADARNTKRNSDLNNLESAISSKMSAGQGLMSFITTSTAGNVVATGSIAGFTGGALTQTMYDAGTINFDVLGVKQADFQDPATQQDYVIGATSKKGGKYELSATVEVGGNRVAKVSGDYTPRIISNVMFRILSINPQIRVSLNNQAEASRLLMGDRMSLSGSIYEIQAISIDNKFYTITSVTGALTLIPNSNNTGTLLANEQVSLIDVAGTGTGFVTDGGANLPY